MEILWDSWLRLPLLIAMGIGCIQWICWIFKVGRFRHEACLNEDGQSIHLRYMMANFFVNIINDFRHLLALFIVSIFAATLFISLYKTASGDTATIMNTMQSVSSTFGGLIGAIIGFYFGEKTGEYKKEAHIGEVNKISVIAEQEDPLHDDTSDVIEVRIPNENNEPMENKE